MQPMNPTSMAAGWISKAVDGNEIFMGLSSFSQKTAGLDLIQNCDLPPPMKVFTGSDQTVVSSMNRICSMMVREDADHNSINDFDRGKGDGDGDDDDDEKLELLKALRLSQTRAREAEKRAENMVKEKDCLSNALLAEAKELFAYRQWVRMLELKVSKLHSKWAEQENQACCGCGRSKPDHEGENGDGITWIAALALCLGIAGVGFAFGCRYLY